MPRLRLTLTPALAACLLALGFQPARTQEPPPARVNFIVAGEGTQSAGGLRAEELRVTVGGVEQSVSALTRDESPLSFGLVVDNSGSLRTQLKAVAAAAQAIASNLRPDDEGFIVRFVSSDNITLLQGFTSDKASLARALGQMREEGGQTAVIDAVHLAAQEMTRARPARPGPSRRALVLITDGEDRASYYTLEQLLKTLRQDGIRVYCIGLTGALDKEPGFISASRRERAEKFLTRVAAETGGRAFFATKVGELSDAVEQIVAHLRSEYAVEFVPAGKKGAGASGKLEIKLRDPGKSGRAVTHMPLRLKAGRVTP